MSQPITGHHLFHLIKERMGWSEEYLADINNAEHPPLQDLDLMCKALEHLRKNNMEITVIPDFDTDGICAGMILYAGLSELGLNTHLHVPDYRLGHEIQPEVIDDIMQQHPHTQAVITCDAGTNSDQALTRADQRQLLTLVTDHHVEEEKSLAHIIINPNRLDESYPNKEICGAHVAYQLIDRYAELYHSHKHETVSWLKVFAGIGTVADVMSLVKENRDLVRQALMITRLLLPTPPASYQRAGAMYDEPDEFDDLPDIVNNTTPTLISMLGEDHHPVFLRALKGLSILLEELDATHESVDEQLYGFSIAPAFNATRRINGDPSTGFAVFISETEDKQRQAAATLVAYNNERKIKTREYLNEILEGEQPWAPYVFTTDAPSGMLGLIAQNLMLIHGHPVAVITQKDNGTFSGSMRSPEWFPVIQQLSSLSNPQITAQGHEFACGVSTPTPQALYEALSTLVPARQEEILASGQDLLRVEPAALTLGSDASSDAPLSHIEAIMECILMLKELGPFGRGFPQPAVDVVVHLPSCRIRVMGRQKQHLKITTPEGVDLLWWNRSDTITDLYDRQKSESSTETTGRFRVQLGMNTFMGRTTLQGIINQEINNEETTERTI